VINCAVQSLAPTLEPLVNLCASGVAEQFPELRIGSIEAGTGWVPWALLAMDEAYMVMQRPRPTQLVAFGLPRELTSELARYGRRRRGR